MPSLNVGGQAPDFSLPASTGETVTLSEELRRGPVVLAWYLFDFGRI
jgi:peroxiredoxin